MTTIVPDGPASIHSEPVMRRECQVRIEQPARLRPLYLESFRRNTRLGVRGIILLGLFPSVLVLGSLALQASDGQAVAAWQWLGGVGMGPVLVGLARAALRLLAAGDRFAEICGDQVRLGPVGYTFRPALLVDCKIEPDSNFPDVNRLCFCFRLFRFARPRSWTMMIEDLAEAQGFRQTVLERSA